MATLRILVLIDGAHNLRGAFDQLAAMGFQQLRSPKAGGSTASVASLAISRTFYDRNATTAALSLAAGAGGAVEIELVELPWLTSARRALRRPPRARVVSLHNTSTNKGGGHRSSVGVGVCGQVVLDLSLAQDHFMYQCNLFSLAQMGGSGRPSSAARGTVRHIIE